MKKWIALGLCAALCVATTACGTATEDEMTQINLCEVTHSIFYAPQYVAMELGFFEENGIEITLTNGGGADTVMAGVISGDVDIGLAGPEASVYVYNEGKDDYCEVFAQLTTCDGSFLMAREPDENFTWDSLIGAHILPGRVGGVPYMALSYAITQNGMDVETDVYFDTSIDFDMMTAAFLAGTGDYVTMFEPTASMMEAEGEAYIVASVGEEAGELPYTAYFATKSYLADNANLVQRFTNAVYEGQVWVQEHTPEEVALAVQAQFPDTDLDILASAVASYQEIGAYATTPQLTEDSFDRLQTIIMQAGELDEAAPYDKIINNTFADEAVS